MAWDIYLTLPRKYPHLGNLPIPPRSYSYPREVSVVASCSCLQSQPPWYSKALLGVSTTFGLTCRKIVPIPFCTVNSPFRMPTPSCARGTRSRSMSGVYKNAPSGKLPAVAASSAADPLLSFVTHEGTEQPIYPSPMKR
jgi:hypothetical protein